MHPKSRVLTGVSDFLPQDIFPPLQSDLREEHDDSGWAYLEHTLLYHFNNIFEGLFACSSKTRVQISLFYLGPQKFHGACTILKRLKVVNTYAIGGCNEDLQS